MRIVDVIIRADDFVAELDDGSTFCVPYHLYPRLSYASPKERANFKIICRGEGIHWFDIDEDISVENIRSGGASDESKKSLQKWLASRNQLAAGA
jgi:hypothetical protein